MFCAVFSSSFNTLSTVNTFYFTAVSQAVDRGSKKHSINSRLSTPVRRSDANDANNATEDTKVAGSAPPPS